MAKGSDPGDKARFLADVLAFGWTLPSAIAAGAALGWITDRFLHTFPVITIVLGLLGAAGGLVQVYREMTRIAEEGSGEPPEKPR